MAARRRCIIPILFVGRSPGDLDTLLEAISAPGHQGRPSTLDRAPMAISTNGNRATGSAEGARVPAQSEGSLGGVLRDRVRAAPGHFNGYNPSLHRTFVQAVQDRIVHLSRRTRYLVWSNQQSGYEVAAC